MKKLTVFASLLAVVALASCKKDVCTIDGEKYNCDDAYGTTCTKVQLEAFQAACKAAGGKLSTK